MCFVEIAHFALFVKVKSTETLIDLTNKNAFYRKVHIYHKRNCEIFVNVMKIVDNH